MLNIMEGVTQSMAEISMFLLVLTCSCNVAIDVNVAVFAFKYEYVIIWSETRLLPAIEIAQETISHHVESGTYANFSLQLVYIPDSCNSLIVNEAIGGAAQLYFEDDVIAYFGPSCSYNLLSIADFAASMNVPIFSGSASTHELDNKDRYPTLTQTVYKPKTMGYFLRELFNHYGWDSYVLLVKGYFFYLAKGAIENSLHEEGKRVHTILMSFDVNVNDHESALKEAAIISHSKYEFIGTISSLICLTLNTVLVSKKDASIF